MDCSRVLSLQDIALLKVAAALWSSKSGRNILLKFSKSVTYQNEEIDDTWSHSAEEIKLLREQVWQSRVKILTLKIDKLSLPESFKDKLTEVVISVGWRILSWKELHAKLLNCKILNGSTFFRRALGKISWTALGTIDLKRTAEAMLDDEDFDMNKKFILATTFCMEQRIHALSGQLGNATNINLKKDDFKGVMPAFWLSKLKDNLEEEFIRLRRFYEIYEKLDFSITSDEYAFLQEVGNGNEMAARYFIDKLSLPNKEKVMMKAATKASYGGLESLFPTIFFSDVIALLLSNMTREQQTEVLKHNPWGILRLLFDWPWHRFFAPTVRQIMATSSEEFFDHFKSILTSWCYENDLGANDKRMCAMLWEQVPMEWKKSTVQKLPDLKRQLPYTDGK